MSLRLMSVLCVMCVPLFSQTPAKPVVVLPKTEPGLETAVAWKWWVAPSAGQEWGMPIPEALLPKTTDSTTKKVAVERPETYEVKKGDAIVKIARKFEMDAWQLKQFNDLKNDIIQVGQVLRIPTQGELLTMVPPPPPKEQTDGKKKPGKAVVVQEPEREIDPGGERQRELDTVRLQVFLDREMFSSGAINGRSGGFFQKASEAYQRTHEDAANPGLLQAKAEATVKEPYTRYALRAEDFKFIMPPKPVVKTPDKKHKPKASAKPVVKTTSIDDLIAQDFLGYNDAWEFVAERFHCDEQFLHHINPHLKESPTVGAEFQVPNVIPFEIENALNTPLQPAADPQKPVVASVVLLSRLEITIDGKLVAVMPLATARPGLRGRGSWTVMDVIAKPRMATKREPREVTKPKPGEVPVPLPETPPALEKEQYLAAGPDNPAGVLWINLTKSGSKEALPYGLHGTSIPEKMATLPGIGGFRMTNWDIVRAARLMPAGTAVQWKAQ